MQKNIIVALIAVIVGLFVGYGSHEVFDRDGSRMMSGGMGMMSMHLYGLSDDDFDREFIEEMIVHHEGALDMANLALKNAKHEEIKTLAKNIIASQSKEIQDMKTWYQAWYK